MKIKLLLIAAACLSAPAAFAQNTHDAHGSHGAHMMADASAKPVAPTEGTVRKVDKAAGKITIAHGPLENLGMPGMTMAFRAGDAAMLDQVKAGDKIRFVAERVDGAFSVKQLEVLK
ncbi:copper-binding protein [Aromatoleum toluclasticum]|uniref:copper-binding protein n=1 Tax=Aromatoleum toluclasticum TaxID=92003 RepID=UPI00036292F1|nr:copper-binding protein [Aromatoleum toluclasticum]MCC4115490.1 copper-binding protein [Aromatoleum toluclasticum]